MPLTLRELRKAAAMVLSTTPNPRLDVDQIVNDAGRYLFAMHSWRFRERPPAMLALTQDQDHVELPADFGEGEISHVEIDDAAGFGVYLTTIDQIQQMRAWSVSDATHYYAAVVFPTQTSQTQAPPQPRLELYPAPASTQVNALSVSYRAGWVVLSEPSHVASVPAFAGPLLSMLVRAFCRMYSQGAEGRAANQIDPLADVVDSPVFAAARRADGAVQVNLGPVEGGHLQSGSIHPYWDSVRPPRVS